MESQALVTDLFQRWKGHEPSQVNRLQTSGSNREYFRMSDNQETVIGAYHPNAQENRAFITFTHHFMKHGLPVPEIIMEDLEQGVYLLEDLGDLTLFDLVLNSKNLEGFDNNLLGLYQQVIDKLIIFQLIAGKDLDYSVCYPSPVFDRQSITWDLNYFKYNFLKLAGTAFDEKLLEADFQALISFLLEENKDFFIYRDFQARNIMIRNEKPHFIDYQGGRKGPLQYDLASLLFQVKADIPFEIREQLLDYYLDQAGKIIPLDNNRFKKYYYGFVLLRMLQVMGAYGLRGLFERKPHFINSIPYAVNNFNWLLNQVDLEIKLPELNRVLTEVSKKFKGYPDNQESKKQIFTISLYSFSYKQGIPIDMSGNGGGFVFDCRILPNPGRLEEYKELTGRDKPVQDYLEKQDEVNGFLSSVNDILRQSIDNYLQRGFMDLMVNFGCTGGQHRSVFCAEKTKSFLEQNFPVKVNLVHKELS